MKKRMYKKIMKVVGNKTVRDYFSQELQEKYKGEMHELFLKILEKKFGEKYAIKYTQSGKMRQRVNQYLYVLTIE